MTDLQKLKKLVKDNGLDFKCSQQNALRAKIDGRNSARFGRALTKSAQKQGWQNGPNWGEAK
jgi:hypothetical protein